MKLELHPEASQNYNDKAQEVLKKLQQAPKEYENRGGKPNPNVHAVHTFTAKNIIGEMGFGWTDFTGNVTAKAFSEQGQLIGLFGPDYIELARLAEGMQKSIRPRAVISVRRLSNSIFEWLKQCYRGQTMPPMTEFVLAECEPLVKSRDVWIPISQLFIQSPFTLGKVTFRAITKDMMDDWEQRTLAKAKDAEEITSIKHGFEQHRKSIQALATATIPVVGDPERAHEIAFEQIDRTVSLLRLLSPANIHPTKVCYSAPIGKAHEDSYRFLFVEDHKIIYHSAGLTDTSRRHWNLSNEDLNTFAPELDVLDMLLKSDRLTDFQETILKALVLYSRSSLAKEISDKLLYILIALETAFLRDQGEYIQDAVSLRIAYMQDVSVQARRGIIKNVKAAYALRSSFVHHGEYVDLDDTTTLVVFMRNALLSLMALIPFAATKITRQQFFEHLEDRRLGGYSLEDVQNVSTLNDSLRARLLSMQSLLDNAKNTIGLYNDILKKHGDSSQDEWTSHMFLQFERVTNPEYFANAPASAESEKDSEPAK